MADAIRRLAVRGAPAIGLAAAYGLAVEAGRGGDVRAAAELLASTRPTAVNLRWALDRALAGSHDAEALVAFAESLAAEQLEQDLAIARHGAALIAPGSRPLTHCNTGALATGGAGTALGVIVAAKPAHVWVDETRPLLQGSRLTAWELQRAEVSFEVIPDAGAGALMARGMVDAVVVGADRIAANGDTANKIGTYTIAALAARHDLPFYVAAPVSTIDPATPDGHAIPIEERSPSEVTEVLGTSVAPTGAGALNFAFDVTPAELITAIVCERGVLRPPYGPAIAAL
ncbi:MAG: methylthioribose-phosphate isomerase [Thermoleophilaceae bacterium]|nr:methylthioribose-phosphate isomerase [Thermoleophilaceae bacterium]